MIEWINETNCLWGSWFLDMGGCGSGGRAVIPKWCEMMMSNNCLKAQFYYILNQSTVIFCVFVTFNRFQSKTKITNESAACQKPGLLKLSPINNILLLQICWEKQHSHPDYIFIIVITNPFVHHICQVFKLSYWTIFALQHLSMVYN